MIQSFKRCDKYFFPFILITEQKKQYLILNLLFLMKFHLVLTFLLLICLTSAYHQHAKQIQPIEDEENLNAIPKNNYPVRFAYIDKLTQWWPPDKIAAGMGVPGYTDEKIYNYIALAFWGCQAGSMDLAIVWQKAEVYFGTDFIGSTRDQIQKNLKKKYNDAGTKILVSAFGATEMPTSQKQDPLVCAAKLGKYVLENNLDGCDIDWEDNSAMENGEGEQWLIDFTKALRELLPTHIITHAPQAPYFKKEYYKNGGYVTVHKSVGSLINFYNVQFYNQGDSKYDTYDELFISAHGKFSNTSVQEIVKRGVPANKIVVGKPVTTGDASNTGWIPLNKLGEYTSKAFTDSHWFAGVMFWQYSSDVGGKGMSQAIGYIKEQCAITKDCK